MNADIFPNVEWFQQASVVANESDAFRSLGTIDCRMGFRSGDNVVALTFESFSCTEVSAWEVDRLRDLDFWIEMGPDRWKGFLAEMPHRSRDKRSTRRQPGNDRVALQPLRRSI